jgi:predicted TIM-barrel fold metal-dependent hydrolase
LGAEAPALRLRPSEYVRRQVWWSSQPAVEPEHPEQLSEVWEQFVRAGLQDKLMFASDYPHWDMDSPLRAFPPSLGEEALSRILALNAARLYRLPVDVPVSR